MSELTMLGSRTLEVYSAIYHQEVIVCKGKLASKLESVAERSLRRGFHDEQPEACLV